MCDTPAVWRPSDQKLSPCAAFHRSRLLWWLIPPHYTSYLTPTSHLLPTHHHTAFPLCLYLGLRPPLLFRHGGDHVIQCWGWGNSPPRSGRQLECLQPLFTHSVGNPPFNALGAIRPTVVTPQLGTSVHQRCRQTAAAALLALGAHTHPMVYTHTCTPYSLHQWYMLSCTSHSPIPCRSQ